MENFEIIEKIGEGSYSTVYKVKRKIDNQIYALKKVKLSKLKEKEKNNSLTEVRILASVQSKYVISYKEAFFDEKDSTLGIVMDYADNGDLYQKIKEKKKKKQYFSEDLIWKIFIQLVKGLKALHDLKILHRDLKSANVFLFKNGDVKLGDMNVSKVAKMGLGYTQTGTPYYASPEVWKDLPYDNKSDIWSLGCVLYEMITLNPPFRARTMDELYRKIINGTIDNLPSQYSKDLYMVILMLLKVNPNKRPNCIDILNNKFVKKRIEYLKTKEQSNDNENDNDDAIKQSLLKTIHIPKNLLYLSNHLPKPNYNRNIIKCLDLRKNPSPINNSKGSIYNTKESYEQNKSSFKTLVTNHINERRNIKEIEESNIIEKMNKDKYKNIINIKIIKDQKNKRKLNPIIKKSRSICNDLKTSLNNNLNDYNSIISYKLYDPYCYSNKGIKSIQQNSNTNSSKYNECDKYDFYMKSFKSKRELVKGIYKKLTGGNVVSGILSKNLSCLNIKKRSDNFLIGKEGKIISYKSKLMPISNRCSKKIVY